MCVGTNYLGMNLPRIIVINYVCDLSIKPVNYLDMVNPMY